ncbi:MAG: hypothetical protein AAGK14_12785 [Verrucomicrobiota bacterium]
MNPWQFVVTTILSAGALAAAVITISSSETNRTLEAEIQQEAQKIRGVQQLRGSSDKLLREMIQVSVKNEQMRALLARHGINVNIQPPAAEQPAP